MIRSVLVVGAAGFIGQHLVPALLQAGMRVTAQQHHRKAEFSSEVTTAVAPANYAKLLQDQDAVFWLASGTTPASSASDPQRELRTNLAPLLKLLQALQARPQCRLIYVSSGGTLYGDVDQPADESLAPHPRSYYAACKAAAEHFIEACCRQYGGQAVVLRPSNVYGPGQALHQGFGVIPAAMGCLLHGRPMELWGDGESLRDYLYIDDFVTACLTVLHQPAVHRLQTYNVCSGQATSLNQLLGLIEQATGRTLHRVHHSARAMDLQRVLLNGTRIRSELGWSSRTSLLTGLEKTWRAFGVTAR